MNNAVLELHQVARNFSSKEVLRGVDLAVPTGSVLGLLGKNGAGKTTLLKCALGLLRLHGGSAILLGDDAWSLSAATKAKLGYVPQIVSLYPWMKISQMIDYTAAFYPRWNDALVADLVQRWELNPKDRIGPLSVGQLQKLALVLALGHEPELLVLDEPAASLDPAARREFLKQILAIADNGRRTVLFSTHITSDLERVADRVAILKEGRIIYNDALDDLKDSVKRLHVRATKPLPLSFALPGSLSQQVAGCEALVAVRDASPAMVRDVAQHWQADVEVQDLNLEDIFLELHHD